MFEICVKDVHPGTRASSNVDLIRIMETDGNILLYKSIAMTKEICV